MKKDRLLVFNEMVSKKYKLYKICQKNIIAKEAAILNKEFEAFSTKWSLEIFGINSVIQMALDNNYNPGAEIVKKLFNSIMYITFGMVIAESFRGLYAKYKLRDLSKALEKQNIFVDFSKLELRIVDEEEYSTMISASDVNIFSNSKRVIYLDDDREVDITNTVENTLNKNIFSRRKNKNK